MAQVPYAGGADDVQPDARPPDDYQHIEANPSSFGGAIAQGAEKAGAGAVDLSKFWGHVQADDASNNAQKEASDFAEHIRSLQGQDALDAQKSANTTLDSIYAKYRNQLGTPDQQHFFDNQNRPFFDRYIRGQLNTTFIDAGRQFATKTADAGIEVAHSMAATAGSDGNWATVEVSYHKALSGEIKKLQSAGMEADPDSIAAAKDKAALVYKSGLEGMATKDPDGAFAKLDDPKLKTALGSNYDATAKSVRDSVARSYISKADTIEVNDPTKAEAFVRANEAKFGVAFGAALDKAHQAADRAVGKGGGNASWDAVGGGPPKTTPVSSNAQVYGDSLGEGVKTAYGLSGDTKVGRTPQQVYDVLHALPDGSLAGKPVVISTGLSNSPKDVGYAFSQISEAIKKGAKPSDITVMGVGDRADFAGLNDRIKKFANETGAKFQPVDPSKLSPDRVHPASYSGLLGGVAPAAASGKKYSGDDLYPAFHGQESGGGKNTTTSVDNAHGDMQIILDTFNRFAKPGETIDNPEDNKRVGHRILEYYSQKYNGDAARVAVAYFSGEGNVAPPGSATPWKENRHDGQGTFVSQYVNGILGRLGAPGVAATTQPLGHGSLSASGTMARPGWEDAAPSAEPESLETVKPTDAALTTSPPAALTPPAPPQTPEDVVNAIYDRQSAAMQHLQGMGLTPEQMIEGERQITQRAAFETAAAGEQQRAVAAREKEATDDVLGTARKESYTAAYAKLNALMADPRRPLSEKAFDTLSDVLERRSGNPNPISYGSEYADALKNIVEPKSETDRISDPRDILKMEADGKLTAKGSDHLLGVLDKTKKSTSELGMQQREAGVLSYAKDYLDKSVNEPYYQVKDPEGKGIYELKFLNMFYGQLDDWRNANKNMADFPLFDQKKLDQMLTILRPRAKINEFQIGAGGQEAPDAPLPPPPANVAPAAWQSYVTKPPSVGGKPITHTQWANVLSILSESPTNATMQYFDKHFGPAGFSAERTVRDLRGSLVGKPETVGNEPPKQDALAPVFNTTMGISP